MVSYGRRLSSIIKTVSYMKHTARVQLFLRSNFLHIYISLPTKTETQITKIIETVTPKKYGTNVKFVSRTSFAY